MEITTVEQLEAIVGLPTGLAVTKERSALTEIDRAWLAATPSACWPPPTPRGRCDGAAPRATRPASWCTSSTSTRSRIAERPGNRRVDGYRNVLANPHVGLTFLIPGRGDTLRINGRARLVDDAAYFDAMAVRGTRPILALEVEIEDDLLPLRQGVPALGAVGPGVVGARVRVPPAVIAHELEHSPRTLEDLDDYYRPEDYGKNLY